VLDVTQFELSDADWKVYGTARFLIQRLALTSSPYTIVSDVEEIQCSISVRVFAISLFFFPFLLSHDPIKNPKTLLRQRNNERPTQS
jgi:hypothetical protein